jgi:hypothetical protein
MFHETSAHFLHGTQNRSQDGSLPFFMEHKMGLKMGLSETQKSSPLLALVYSFSLAVAQPQSHTHTSPQNLTRSSQ